MLVQLVTDLLPQRIQEELHAFSPCKLGRRHEIAVTGHEYQRINLTLKRHAGDIQTDASIQDRMMRDPVIWRSVVVEEAIDVVEPKTFDILVSAQVSETLNVALTLN